MGLTANHNIAQIVEVCSDFEKRNKLVKHLDQISQENAKVLIFVATKRVADEITKYLRTDGWPALAIHGDKEQRERDWVLSEFKAGRSPILIATDVASRGLGMFLFLMTSATMVCVVALAQTAVACADPWCTRMAQHVYRFLGSPPQQDRPRTNHPHATRRRRNLAVFT